jgi:hypothetical protein
MEIRQLEIIEGHPVIRDEENVILIDTGSPITIHNNNVLTFCGHRYETTTNSLGMTPATLGAMAGFKMTTLLGADVLSNYVVRFDYKMNTVAFGNSDEIPTDGCEALPVTFTMGIPSIEACIRGRTSKVFFDTGARLSYIEEAFTTELDNCGIEKDFYPSFGAFETGVYMIDSTFGQSTIPVKYGVLPNLLRTMLSMVGVDGIVGYDFLANFETTLDYRGKTLYFK